MDPFYPVVCLGELQEGGIGLTWRSDSKILKEQNLIIALRVTLF